MRLSFGELATRIIIRPVQAELIEFGTQRWQIQPRDATVVAENENAPLVTRPMSLEHRFRVTKIQRGEVATGLKIVELQTGGLHQGQPALRGKTDEILIRRCGAPRHAAFGLSGF